MIVMESRVHPRATEHLGWTQKSELQELMSKPGEGDGGGESAVFSLSLCHTAA